MGRFHHKGPNLTNYDQFAKEMNFLEMGLQMRFPDPKTLEMNLAQFKFVVLGPVRRSN